MRRSLGIVLEEKILFKLIENDEANMDGQKDIGGKKEVLYSADDEKNLQSSNLQHIKDVAACMH